jgi:Flp pilus assembly pilin Flp
MLVVFVLRCCREQTMGKKKAAEGVTIVEYAIMLALVAIAIAASVPSITSAVNDVFTKSSSIMK